MVGCLQVPEYMRSEWGFRAKLRQFFEGKVFPDYEVTRVFMTEDGKRCHVSIVDLEPLGTGRRGYPEFDKKVYNITYDVKPAPNGNFDILPPVKICPECGNEMAAYTDDTGAEAMADGRIACEVCRGYVCTNLACAHEEVVC